jgi:signal transduction histidine kinase
LKETDATRLRRHTADPYDQATLAELAKFPDMNPGPVLRLDREGTVLVGNAAARRFFGQTELIGSCWLDLCPGMDGEVWGRVLESRNAFSHEAETGGACMVFTHVRSETGRFVFVFGADITDRRAAERRLAEVARFPDMNPGPVLRLGLDGVVLLANVAAREVFGAELADRCWLDLCPGMDPDVWRGVIEAAEPVLFAARIGNREYVFTHRREAGGELVFVFGADVTQEKQSERALRQSQKMATLGTLAAGVAHELNNPAAATSRAADQLRDAVAQLEEAHLRLDAAGLTPEAREQLKTLEQQARERAVRADDLDPLERSDREAEVEEWLEEHGVDQPWQLAPLLARRGLDPPELARLATVFQGEALPAALAWAGTAFSVYTLLHEIGQGSTRISEIVRALKSYSYLGQAPVQAIDLHEGLDNTLVILRNKLKAGITVHRDYCSDLPRVPAHGSELNQVWTNLLDNAADAMGGKGEITIRTRRREQRVDVEIEDNGPGIPDEVQPRIFDPFYTTKAPGKGTGLGLSTSYSIVTEKHQGEIRVESRPGLTRFTVRLPLEPAEPSRGE